MAPDAQYRSGQPLPPVGTHPAWATCYVAAVRSFALLGKRAPLNTPLTCRLVIKWVPAARRDSEAEKPRFFRSRPAAGTHFLLEIRLNQQTACIWTYV